MDEKTENTHVEVAPNPAVHIVPIDQEANENVEHVNLSWRSWVVVFCCCFAYVAHYQSA
jgi:hypothetical protein